MYVYKDGTHTPTTVKGRWIVHVIHEHSFSGACNYVDNYGDVYAKTDDKYYPVCYYSSYLEIIEWTPSKFPLSVPVIAAIKRLHSAANPICLTYPDILLNVLQPYREVARLEYILHQHLTCTPSVKPLETAIHRLTTDLETEKSKNKMLEARLSALETILAPNPSPPKEVDLLGISTPTTPSASPLSGAVIDAEETSSPMLIITDTC